MLALNDGDTVPDLKNLHGKSIAWPEATGPTSWHPPSRWWQLGRGRPRAFVSRLNDSQTLNIFSVWACSDQM